MVGAALSTLALFGALGTALAIEPRVKPGSAIPGAIFLVLFAVLSGVEAAFVG